MSRCCVDCGGPTVMHGDLANRCIKHAKFVQMIRSARKGGKRVPTMADLEAALPADMRCPDCGRTMVWTMAESTKLCASLQHYRDGTLGIVCLSCNSRHRDLPGGLYRTLPPGTWRCRTCEQILPLSAFYPARGGRERSGICKPCGLARQANYRALKRARKPNGVAA